MSSDGPIILSRDCPTQLTVMSNPETIDTIEEVLLKGGMLRVQKPAESESNTPTIERAGS